MVTGILDVSIVSASLAPIHDPGDAYVLVKCGYTQFLTHTVTDHGLFPTWNKTSTLSLQGENANNNVVVELYSRRQQSPELLGLVRIPLSKALSTTGMSLYTLTRPDLGECGQMKIAFHWESSALESVDNQEIYNKSAGKGTSNSSSTGFVAPSAPAFPESANYDFYLQRTSDTSPISKTSVDSATAAFSGLEIDSRVHKGPGKCIHDSEAVPYPDQTRPHPSYANPSANYPVSYGARPAEEGKRYPPPGSASFSVADFGPPSYPPLASSASETVAPKQSHSPYPPPPYPLPSDSVSKVAAPYLPPNSSYPPLAGTNIEPGEPYAPIAPTHSSYPPREFPPKGGNKEDLLATASPYEFAYPPPAAPSDYPHTAPKGSNIEYAYPPPSNPVGSTAPDYPPAPYGQVGSSLDDTEKFKETTDRGLNSTQDRGKNSGYGYQPGGYPPPAAYPQAYPSAGSPAGYPPPGASYPPSAYPAYPSPGYPPAPYAPSGYPPQYPSYPAAPYPSSHGYHGGSSHAYGPDLGYMGGAAGYGAYALHGHGHGHDYGHVQHHGHGHEYGHGHGHGHKKHHKHYGYPEHYGHGHHHKHKHHKFKHH